MGKKKSKKGKKGDQSNPLLEDPLDVQENEERLLDDAAKSMVIKNPLLGTFPLSLPPSCLSDSL